MASGMAATAPREASPAALNLSSNNPFRNRTSPLPSPNTLEPPAPSSRNNNNRISRNPFLDSNVAYNRNSGLSASGSDTIHGLTADIFGDLSLLDKPSANGPPPPYSRPPRPGGPSTQLNPNGSISPAKRDARPAHFRRNSESSVMEKDKLARRERDRSERPPRTESEERRRRERRKEREERHRKDKSRGKRPQRGLDLIDKLDVTGVYGQGVFHHDGPFDACNPHRNIKKDKRAPMHAFPADSMNMALGGSGPLRSRLDLDRIHGRGEEGFSDYATARKANTATIINPTDRVEQVHGQETYGLGTSTFLDGAPASRSALQRRESEDASAQDSSLGGGLQRKKSLAQRLRGMSSGRRERPADLRRSPDARYLISSNRNIDSSAVADGNMSPPARAVSAGGPTRAKYTRENEVNPFDTEYNDAFDKKGTQIRILEQSRPQSSSQDSAAAASSSSRVPPVPKFSTNTLTRARTQDSPPPPPVRTPDEEKPAGGGLLSRMKSLRGGRRARPERRESEA